MLGLLSIAILFTIYGICAVAITLRAIEAQEKALDERPYGDRPFVNPELRGIEAPGGISRGGGGVNAKGLGTQNSGSHSHDAEGSTL
jgi:hypothetical protein